MTVDNSLFSNEYCRQLINPVLDQLIPASADRKIPAAGALGIASFLARVSTADPEVGKILEHGFKKTAKTLENRGNSFENLGGDKQIEFVKQIEQQQPAFFAVLLRYTYMGYYSRADIRPLLGLSAKPTQPEGYEVPIESPAEMVALTRAVKDRGQCFRTC